MVIASYALAGFANFGSIAMQIAGMGELAPNKRAMLAELGLRALIGGLIASLMTAAVAGILLPWVHSSSVGRDPRHHGSGSCRTRQRARGICTLRRGSRTPPPPSPDAHRGGSGHRLLLRRPAHDVGAWGRSFIGSGHRSLGD